MAEQTGIEWCDATFNPWIGCEKVSPGCAHCYAETLVHGRMGRAGTWGADGVRQVTSDSNWKKPLRWARLTWEGLLPDGTPNPDGRRPRVFCASLADVFEDRPELAEPRVRLFELIEATPELDWQILTKRPEHARDWLFKYDGYAPGPLIVRDDEHHGWGCPPNVWLGVSIENARHTWRADVLREIPAAVRFLSCEPLLGSLFEGSHRGDDDGRADRERDDLVVLERARERDVREATAGDRRHEPVSGLPLGHGLERTGEGAGRAADARDTARQGAGVPRRSRAPLDLTGIDWVIAGGESGPGARPMRLDWVREILEAVDERRICHDHQVALFVKQLGAKPTAAHPKPIRPGDTWALHLRDRKGGDWTEWPADLRIREFPSTTALSPDQEKARSGC